MKPTGPSRTSGTCRAEELVPLDRLGVGSRRSSKLSWSQRAGSGGHASAHWAGRWSSGCRRRCPLDVLRCALCEAFSTCSEGMNQSPIDIVDPVEIELSDLEI